MPYIISISPVIVFLLALKTLDSFKLVRLKSVLAALLGGFLAAAVCYVINRALLEAEIFHAGEYSRYIAPVIEEVLKSLLVFRLIVSRRIGFLVDAAIYGFAIGAGFAIIENIYYVRSIPEATIIAHIVRGFGTAIMHGGATALFGIVVKALFDRYGKRAGTIYFAGIALPIVIHSLFNHFFISPTVTALILMLGLPLLMVAVFRRSERSLREWLGTGFDIDTELLQMIGEGNISSSPVGRYLLSLKIRFPGEIVADMLCLLRIHLELSIRAKGILLMKGEGFEPPTDSEVVEKFGELKYLEKNIGRTGMLAIHPLFRLSSRDLWQLHMLKNY